MSAKKKAGARDRGSRLNETRLWVAQTHADMIHLRKRVQQLEKRIDELEGAQSTTQLYVENGWEL